MMFKTILFYGILQLEVVTIMVTMGESHDKKFCP